MTSLSPHVKNKHGLTGNNHFVSGGLKGIDGAYGRQLTGWRITLSGCKSELCVADHVCLCGACVPKLTSLILLDWFVQP